MRPGDAREPVARDTRRAHRLVVVEGRSRGAELVLGEGPATIGRGLGNDLVVDDGRVSRRHLQVRAHGAAVMVEDLGSRNGTRVGGLPLVGARVVPEGERIAIGRTVIAVGLVPAAAPAARPVPPGCRRSRALIERGIDGELTPAADAALRVHLAGCPGCRSRHEVAVAWRDVLRDSLVEPVPPGFAERVTEVLRAEPRP